MNITEIAPDVYRLSLFVPEANLQFNQFLVKDDEPLLFHTGMRGIFPLVREAVAKIINPADLRHIGFSHFEGDECGALNDWLQVAPHAQAVCSLVGALVNVNDFAIRPARPLNDNEGFEIGQHRLRFLSTPHVPHGWDAGLFFEESERTLFCSDLFFQPGEAEPLVESGVVERAREAIVAGINGPMPKDMPYTHYTDQTLQRLAELNPQTLATMHGSSFRGDGRAAILDLATIVRATLGNPDAGV